MPLVRETRVDDFIFRVLHFHNYKILARLRASDSESYIYINILANILYYAYVAYVLIYTLFIL